MREQGKMGKSDQQVQTCGYKINTSWGYNVQRGNYSSHIVYLKFAKGVDFRNSQE